MSLYYDSGVLVKLYIREEFSDAVARFLVKRQEAFVINGLHEIEMRNALRLKRFRDEIDDEQLAASIAMLSGDLAARRLIRAGVDWQSVFCGGRAPVRDRDHDRWHRSTYHRSDTRRRCTQPGSYGVGVAGPPATRGGPVRGPRAR